MSVKGPLSIPLQTVFSPDDKGVKVPSWYVWYQITHREERSPRLTDVFINILFKLTSLVVIVLLNERRFRSDVRGLSKESLLRLSKTKPKKLKTQ